MFPAEIVPDAVILVMLNDPAVNEPDILAEPLTSNAQVGVILLTPTYPLLAGVIKTIESPPTSFSTPITKRPVSPPVAPLLLMSSIYLIYQKSPPSFGVADGKTIDDTPFTF